MNGGSLRLYTIEANANPDAPKKPVHSVMRSAEEFTKMGTRTYLVSLGLAELG